MMFFYLKKKLCFVLLRYLDFCVFGEVFSELVSSKKELG